MFSFYFLECILGVAAFEGERIDTQNMLYINKTKYSDIFSMFLSSENFPSFAGSALGILHPYSTINRNRLQFHIQ
jgi:hypothetical protein